MIWKLIASFITILIIAMQPVRADYMVDFIRIACVQEAGFFELEHRQIHNNPAEAASTKAWARQGFYSPSGLTYECSLGEVKYKVFAKQDSWRERGMCAAAPEVILTVRRNDEVIADKVVLGRSCYGSPTITRISMSEEKRGYFGKEAEICFLTKDDNNAEPKCEWFFDGLNGFQNAFPLKQETLSEQFLKWRAE
jgi:hypothetical protein